MASDGAKATKQLRKKINKNEKKLAAELASINAGKMGAILKRLRTSVGSLRRQAELAPEQAVAEATSRRKRKAARTVSFQIDRSPELDEEILLQRRILTPDDTTDKSADSSVESDGGESLSCGGSDLDLCLEPTERAASGARGCDPWWLHPEDREPPKPRRRRYFHTERHRCEVCDMRGHFGDACPLGGPICVLCGKLGHRKDACRSIVCHACLRSGHEAAACAMAAQRRDAKCLRCGAMGHVQQDCFEKWRQFHVTTAPGSTTPVKAKQKSNPLVFCSNCAKKGHFSDDCFRPRPRSRHLFGPGSAFVSSYDKQPTFPPLPETPRGWRAKDKEKKAKKKATRAECGCGQEEDTNPAPLCETPRVRPGSDLGDFVPLGKVLKRKSPPDGREATRKRKKRRKKGEEDKSFEAGDGVSFREDLCWNLVRNEGETPATPSWKSHQPQDAGSTAPPAFKKRKQWQTSQQCRRKSFTQETKQLHLNDDVGRRGKGGGKRGEGKGKRRGGAAARGEERGGAAASVSAAAAAAAGGASPGRRGRGRGGGASPGRRGRGGASPGRRGRGGASGGGGGGGGGGGASPGRRGRAGASTAGRGRGGASVGRRGRGGASAGRRGRGRASGGGRGRASGGGRGTSASGGRGASPGRAGRGGASPGRAGRGGTAGGGGGERGRRQGRRGKGWGKRRGK